MSLIKSMGTKIHLGDGSPLKVAHCRKFQNYETVKGGCIPSKKKFKTQKSIKFKVARYWHKFQTGSCRLMSLLDLSATDSRLPPANGS